RGVPAPARRGRGDRGAGPDARARPRHHRAHLPMGSGGQPLGPGALRRRVVGRLGGGGGRAAGRRLGGLGQRRVHPAPPGGGAGALAVRISAEALATFPTALLADVDPVTRATLKYSMLFPAPALARSDRIRAAIRRWLADAFARCDVLAWPTVPAPAPPIDNP